MRLVTIYYNDVFVSVTGDEAYEIYDGCPYVNIDSSIAQEYAEEKIENGEWDAFLIPEFVTNKVVYHLCTDDLP